MQLAKREYTYNVVCADCGQCYQSVEQFGSPLKCGSCGSEFIATQKVDFSVEYEMRINFTVKADSVKQTSVIADTIMDACMDAIEANNARVEGGLCLKEPPLR